MKRLSTLTYWDAIHERQMPRVRPASEQIGLRQWIKRRLGERGILWFKSYRLHLLWDVLYPRYLPQTPGLRLLEIGSAPGNFLVTLQRRFGYDVYGLDYSDAGVANNRRIFAAAGIDPDHVIHADFLADEILREWAGQFDIVISRGFIEHFDNVEDVVARHLTLLAPGGTLAVSIPNKRGINRAFTWLFHRQSLAIHNLEIMRKATFRRLFENGQLESRFCDFWGTFSFGQFNTPPGSPWRLVLKALQVVQYPLNVLFRLLAPRGGLESRFTSPGLLYVGVKKGEEKYEV